MPQEAAPPDPVQHLQQAMQQMQVLLQQHQALMMRVRSLKQGMATTRLEPVATRIAAHSGQRNIEFRERPWNKALAKCWTGVI